MKYVTLFLLYVSSCFALTNEQAVRLYNAIHDLDRGVVSGDSSKPFNFGAQTRMNLALDEAELKPLAEAYEVASQSVIRSISPHGIAANDAAAISEYNEKMKSINNTEADGPDGKPVVLRKVALSDLNLDTNQISISDLADLQPVIAQ